MKVAVVTPYWKSKQGGGVEVYVRELYAELRSLNPQIETDIIFIDGHDEEQIKISNGLFREIKGSFFGLKKIKPDIIHIFDNYELLIGAALYCTLYRKTPIIHSFLTEPRYPTKIMKKISRLFGKLTYQWALDHCEGISFVSKDLQKKIDLNFKFVFNQPIDICYPGYRTRSVTKDEVENFSRSFTINPDNVILISMGVTSHPFKAEGAKYLLSAVRELIPKFPSLILIITGGGQYLDDLKRYANRIGLQNHVLFPGFIENQFIPLSLAQIYCHITFAEGLPLAILEAMSMEKPVIATKTGGIPEAIDDGVNGVLANKDPASIAEKISQCIENPKYSKLLGSNAKRTVNEHFQWSTTALQIIEIYNRCLNK